MTADLYEAIVAAVVIVAMPVLAVWYAHRMDGSVAPRHLVMDPWVADDPYDEDTGLDRLEKYGPKGRLK